MAINIDNKNIAKNITFKNIQIERITQETLFYLIVIFNKHWNKAPGGYTSNIKFENIHFYIVPQSKSFMHR